MTDKSDKELADDVRQAAETLNEALEAAATARIEVSFDAGARAILNGVPQKKVTDLAFKKAF